MDDNITLREGLDKFREQNHRVFSIKKMSKKGEEFLKCHDIAHVVFGCNTTIYGEGLVKIWSTFGTTLSFWKVVKGYNEVQAFELAKKYSVSHVLKNIGRLLLVIPKAILHVKRMSNPWPFLDYKPYLDTPLHEIRSEFNIKIIR